MREFSRTDRVAQQIQKEIAVILQDCEAGGTEGKRVRQEMPIRFDEIAKTGEVWMLRLAKNLCITRVGAKSQRARRRLSAMQEAGERQGGRSSDAHNSAPAAG